jgi:hypothetical protein
MPVAIRMDLSFKETEIITKQFLSGEKVKYKSPFRGDEAINGLDIGNERSGELRTPEQIAASTALKDFNETGITFETTATSSSESVLATEALSEGNAAGIDESGSSNTERDV